MTTTNRFRVRDERTLVKTGATYYILDKNVSCEQQAAWRPVGSVPPNLWKVGSYSHMDDVSGDRPRPDLGLAGFRFHPMSSSKQTITAGEGATGWTVQFLSESCPPPYSYYRQFRRVSDGLTMARQFCGFGFTVDPTGRLILPVILDPKGYTQCINLAVTACHSKVGRGGSETNLYETLAETDKSLKLVSGYLEQARRIASPGLVRKVQAVGNAYLMTRYGFKPLVNDLFHSLEAMHTQLGRVFETVRGAESVVSTSSATTFAPDSDYVQVNGLTTRTQTVAARAMILSTYNRERYNALGLGFKNLATVPWELLPYSFVIDWFVNVGDFLGSLVPVLGVQQIGSTLSVSTVTHDVWQATSYAATSNTMLTIPPGHSSASCTWESKNRIVGLPGPVITLKTNFKLDNLTRALDASSLLLQRLRG